MKLFEEIKEIILDYVEPDDEITAESRLKADCGLSSFDMMCLTDAINEKYGIKLSFENIRSCLRVGELCETVGEYIQ